VEFVGSLLRAARKRHDLTQKQVQARTGISQGNLANLERHPGQNVTLRVVDRVLAAVGEQLVAVPSRAPTAELTAARITDALERSHRDLAWRAALVFHDGLREAEPAVRCALAVAEPATTGDNGWDALLAGIVDHVIPSPVRPAWTKRRHVPEWYVTPDFPEAVQQAVRAATPPAFRAHGVYVAADDLESL
jgi:transcriptional regulator with XRE-family HTH domain